MTYTIGQLAGKAGVSVETVRFYERRQLIERPIRPIQGYRRYSEAILNRLHFIKRAKELGFKLNEIGNLLLLGEGQCDDVKSLAEEKLSQVKTRLNHLHRLEHVLQELLVQCASSGGKTECPIIESLLKE